MKTKKYVMGYRLVSLIFTFYVGGYVLSYAGKDIATIVSICLILILFGYGEKILKNRLDID